MLRGLVLALGVVLCFCSPAWSEDAKDEMEGVWIPVTAELGGMPFPDAILKTIKLEVKGGDYLVTVGTQPDRGTCKLDPTAKPKAVDISGTEGPNKGKTFLAIYERKGDTLKVCYDLAGKTRPTEFKTKEKTLLYLVEYKLQKP